MACKDCNCGRLEREIARKKSGKKLDEGCGPVVEERMPVVLNDDAFIRHIGNVLGEAGAAPFGIKSITPVEVPEVLFQKLELCYSLPTYGTPGAAAMDLYSTIDIVVRETPVMVPTGFKMALPIGYEAQIRPRSGLAINHGIMVVNSPGTIDSDYRGEVCVILTCLYREGYRVKRGDRIAQMVIAQVPKIKLTEVRSLDETERGTGGFGHSGR